MPVPSLRPWKSHGAGRMRSEFGKNRCAVSILELPPVTSSLSVSRAGRGSPLISFEFYVTGPMLASVAVSDFKSSFGNVALRIKAAPEGVVPFQLISSDS